MTAPRHAEMKTEIRLPAAGLAAQASVTRSGLSAALQRPPGSHSPSVPLRCTAKDSILIFPQFSATLLAFGLWRRFH